MAIDYQPGSPCAGQIFANKYNLRLAFYMFDDQWLETEIQKQIVNFDQAENRLILLDKMGSPIGKQTYKDVYKSFNDMQSETEKLHNLTFLNFDILNNPSLIWQEIGCIPYLGTLHSS